MVSGNLIALDLVVLGRLLSCGNGLARRVLGVYSTVLSSTVERGSGLLMRSSPHPHPGVCVHISGGVMHLEVCCIPFAWSLFLIHNNKVLLSKVRSDFGLYNNNQWCSLVPLLMASL